MDLPEAPAPVPSRAPGRRDPPVKELAIEGGPEGRMDGGELGGATFGARLNTSPLEVPLEPLGVD